MIIPNYKTIVLNGQDKQIIHQKLSSVDWNNSPVVINIIQLKEMQIKVLSILEECFEQMSLSLFPYGIYILAYCPEYKGKLTIVNSTKELPQFFQQKTRQLNSKENFALNKVTLKRSNLQGLRGEEYQTLLKYYADNHKKIHHLQSEFLFLDKVNLQLDKYYGKKE